MAQPTQTLTFRGQWGGTILGFMAGLVFGLAIAVCVAIFVTRAPVPFVNKIGKTADRIAEPKTAADAPDPNKPLYSKNKSPGAPTPDPLSAVIANASNAASVRPPADPGLPAATATDPTGARGADAEKITYLLQAGAFRSQDDADGMKAKLALIGYEARILSAEVNGQTLYRVRVGPYAQLDDMNKARAKLAESGIEASVVRQK
jgi:cell division protein FtsN